DMSGMDNHNTESTLTVQGFTPYAQIPKWILRAGDKLSHAALRLYGVIMSYADNTTRTAFPGQEKLTQDLGVSVRSIFTYMKDIEKYGALIVERRRNKRTGNYYANNYALVFTDPSEVEFRRPSETGDRITRPTSLTRSTDHVTSKTSFDREENHLTNETRSEEHT